MKVQHVKTRQQIADEYGISRKTLYSWLKKAEIKLKNSLITPKELQEIYNEFGLPNQKLGG